MQGSNQDNLHVLTGTDKYYLFIFSGEDKTASIDYLRFSDSNVAIENQFGNMTITNSAITGNNVGLNTTGSVVNLTQNTFENNVSTGEGGAIYNSGASSVLNIEGNKFNSNKSGTSGGAIRNISGNIISSGNNTFTLNTSKSGGAMYIIGDNTKLILKNDVLNGNSAQNEEINPSFGYGGAIYKSGKSSLIDLDGTFFVENKAELGGGAIYFTQSNDGPRGNAVLNANNTIFEGNIGGGNTYYRGGGAIFAENGVTTNIGNNNTFSNNQAENGGHIFNYDGTLNIGENNVFQNGSALGSVYGWGGAIANVSKGANIATLNINNLNSFENNSAVYGGAIYQSTKGATYIGADGKGMNQFMNNNSTSKGGAIYSNDTLVINGENTLFENNSSKEGGAIYINSGKAEINSTYFNNNQSSANGGAVYTYPGATTDIKNTTFKNNISKASGGAFFNGVNCSTNLENLIFENNKAENGGALYNFGTADISNSVWFANNNSSSNGGAIYNKGTLNLTTAADDNITFANNTNSKGSNDIHNDNATVNIKGDEGIVYMEGGFSGTGNINKNSGNHLIFGKNSTSADYTGNFNQTAGTTTVQGTFFGGKSEISNSTVNWLTDKSKPESGSLKVTNSTLYVGNGSDNHILTLNNANDEINKNTVINLSMNSEIRNDKGNVTFNNDGDIWLGKVTNSGTITLDHFEHDGETAGEYHQTGGETILQNGSKLTMVGNSKITGGDVHVTTDSVLTAGTNENFQNIDNFYITTGGLFNAGIYPFAVKDTMYISNGVVNAISGNTTVNHIGNLNIGPEGADFNIDIDAALAQSDRFIANSITGAGNLNLNNFQIIGQVPTAEKIYFRVFDSNNIDNDITFSTTNTEAVTPRYIYTLKSEGNGLYSLTRPRGESAFNKQAFRGQVATLAMFNNQLLVNQALFDHVYLDSEELLAKSYNANRYASISPLLAPYQYTRNEGGVWFKPYVAFNTLNMTKGLSRVGNNAYGSIVGLDFNPVNLKYGWKFLPTSYIAYNGAHQSFNGVGMYQNGGQAGFMGSFLHRDFITSFLAFGGGYENDMNVQGFTDRTGNWFAGCAAKAAYNYRPSKNLIVQPNAVMSYMIFGNQNWGSNFGQVSMNSGFLNGINLAPGLNVIYGRDTWSVYGSVQYMYFINDKLDGNLNNERLDNIRMKHGYIAYGIGAVKNWKDRFLGYLQITLYNGGVNGVGFQGGISYKF